MRPKRTLSLKGRNRLFAVSIYSQNGVKSAPKEAGLHVGPSRWTEFMGDSPLNEEWTAVRGERCKAHPSARLRWGAIALTSPTPCPLPAGGQVVGPVAGRPILAVRRPVEAGRSVGLSCGRRAIRTRGLINAGLKAKNRSSAGTATACKHGCPVGPREGGLSELGRQPALL